MDIDQDEFAFLRCAKIGDVSGAQYILSQCTTETQLLRCTNEKMETALHISAARGHIDFVHFLMGLDGIDSDAISNTGVTPFVMAAVKGRTAVIRYMLSDARVDPCHVGLRGRGALHGAVRHGHPDTVTLLLTDSRIDPNLADQEGRTPMDDAVRTNRKEIVELLRNHLRIIMPLQYKISD